MTPLRTRLTRTFCATGAVLCALLVALAVPAFAEPVQEFNVQLKDIKPDGRYVVVFTANAYDTTGEQPPLVTDNQFRVAGGIRVRPEFRTKDYQCDVNAVREALVTPDGNLTYTQRLRDLAGTLKRTRSKLRPAIVPRLETCIRANIGSGKVAADVRPIFKELVPANFFVYLAKPKNKGAEIAFSVLVVLDENGWLYKQSPTLRTFRLALTFPGYWEPSADGRFGYRFVLPGGGAGGVRASVSELEVTIPGITQTKCVKKKKGKCLSSKKLFWITQPTCPTSGQVRFESDYVYETGFKITKGLDLPCPRFQL
jgi:hypothetical protein